MTGSGCVGFDVRAAGGPGNGESNDKVSGPVYDTPRQGSDNGGQEVPGNVDPTMAVGDGPCNPDPENQGPQWGCNPSTEEKTPTPTLTPTPTPTSTLEITKTPTRTATATQTPEITPTATNTPKSATSTPESVTPVPFGVSIDNFLPELDGTDVLWWNGFAR